MAGLFAYALAGAAQGLGQGVVDQAKARREEALLMLKRQWQVDDRELAYSRRSRGGSGRSRGLGTTKVGEDGILYRFNPESGSMEPVQTSGGQPFRAQGNSRSQTPAALSASGRTAIGNWLKAQGSGTVDPELHRRMTARADEILRENPGMSENQAINMMFDTANRKVIPGDRGWFGTDIGSTEPREGGYDGTFRSPPQSGQGTAPAPTPSNDAPAMPQSPPQMQLGGGDLARPQSQAEYNQLPSGSRFVDPEGNVRIKP